VEAAELLTEKAREYEVLAASHLERARLGATHDVAAASAFTAVAIVLRYVADALDEAA
jgi:leucyl aminopeptidase